jgi:hypothetical protein
MAKSSRDSTSSGGGTALLKRKPMPLASKKNGILWLKPGAGRDMTRADFDKLFKGYTSICRASRSVRLRSDSDEETEFERGDAIAATHVDREDELLKILEKRGVGVKDVRFGEGPPTSKSR